MILCVVCKTNESAVQRGPGAPLCRPCRAEIVLTNSDPKLALEAVDALFKAEDGKVTRSVEITNRELKAMARAVKCERCSKVEVYDPNVGKGAFFCDGCGKSLCKNCAALCSHKDFSTAKILCTDCRAEKSLTGQPAEEVFVDQPGTEKKREALPHCARASCLGAPNDPDPWCECPCQKCRTAVSSGFPVPMFGKQPPDPDPVPEAPEDKTQTDFDEEEIAEWEGGQQ
jgi:hypothetical protein